MSLQRGERHRGRRTQIPKLEHRVAIVRRGRQQVQSLRRVPCHVGHRRPGAFTSQLAPCLVLLEVPNDHGAIAGGRGQNVRYLRIPAQAGDLGRLLLGGTGADPRHLGIGRVGQVGDDYLAIASTGGQFHGIVRTEGHGRYGPALVLRNGGDEGNLRRSSAFAGKKGRGIKDADGTIGHSAGDDTIATPSLAGGPIDGGKSAGRLDLAQNLGRRLVLRIGNVEAVQLELSAIVVKSKSARFLTAVAVTRIVFRRVFGFAFVRSFPMRWVGCSQKIRRKFSLEMNWKCPKQGALCSSGDA